MWFVSVYMEFDVKTQRALGEVNACNFWGRIHVAEVKWHVCPLSTHPTAVNRDNLPRNITAGGTG